MADDPYSDPKTGVLTNRLGIDNADTLARAETGITEQRIAELKENPVKGNFDLDHLKAIHKHIFQDVYAWAGETRSVDIAKGDTMFAHNGRIEGEANRLFSKVAEADHFKNLDRSTFVANAADAMGDLNALHPFREGNGRAQRAFFEQVAKEAGHPMDLSSVAKKDWIEASKDSFFADNGKMEKAFDSAIDAARFNSKGLER